MSGWTVFFWAIGGFAYALVGFRIAGAIKALTANNSSKVRKFLTAIGGAAWPVVFVIGCCAWAMEAGENSHKEDGRALPKGESEDAQ